MSGACGDILTNYRLGKSLGRDTFEGIGVNRTAILKCFFEKY
jgi:hypothetical protein